MIPPGLVSTAAAAVAVVLAAADPVAALLVPAGVCLPRARANTDVDEIFGRLSSRHKAANSHLPWYVVVDWLGCCWSLCVLLLSCDGRDRYSSLTAAAATTTAATAVAGSDNSSSSSSN